MCTYGMAAISSFELFISYTDHIETEMTVLGKGKKKISDTIFMLKLAKGWTVHVIQNFTLQYLP